MLNKRSYRVEEAARELGCSRAKTYGLISRGELRAFKIGRLTRVHYQQIEEFIQNNPSTSVHDSTKRQD